jgi:hypothetical protein
MSDTAMGKGNQKLRDFLDEFLVVCPGCEKTGRVTLGKDGKAQLTCTACGRTELANTRKWHYVTVIGAPIDPYFKLPLWLQIETRGEILWAYNRRHLAFLKQFVGSKLRDIGQPGNPNLGNKLPKWMLLAKNRDAVLQGIARLNAK